MFKEFTQYYESKPLSGFDVVRLEKNSSTYNITESWSGDMAYKVTDLSTDPPTVYKCYEEAAIFLTAERSDSSYVTGAYNKILSFPDIETDFYSIDQDYPKYIRVFNKIRENIDDSNSIDLTNNLNITDATSINDASVDNEKWKVWYRSITNSYSIEEKDSVFNKRWLLYSIISIILITLSFQGFRFRKRITFK
ncbi:MAG: hypothetical protein WDM71_03880 [Ferruginibacter sp.]